MSEPRFIECLLKRHSKQLGTTTREAELGLVVGTTYCGQVVRFQMWKPMVHAGERRKWTRRGWVIVTRAP